MKSLKVLIVTSFFEREIGYQEVQIADVLRSMGHEIMILTTDRSYLHKKRRLNGQDSGYSVFRISHMLRMRDTVLPLESVKDTIAGFSPDVAFLIHPGHGLGYFVLNSLPENTKVVPFFGDLRNENKLGQAKGFKGNPFVQRTIKDRWYRKVFRRSDLIVANTNETSGILKEIDAEGTASKLLMPGLGYDPNVYNYGPSLGDAWRKEMQIADDAIAIVTVTRILAGKPIGKWLVPVLQAMDQNPRLVYVLAGFMNNPYSRDLKSFLNGSKQAARLRLLDFTDASYNNKMFNGADYSLWFSPTTSIQQSMGTGLIAFLPWEPTLDHLVTQGDNGYYYRSLDELSLLFATVQKPEIDRRRAVEKNKKFSYESILASIFENLR